MKSTAPVSTRCATAPPERGDHGAVSRIVQHDETLEPLALVVDRRCARRSQPLARDHRCLHAAADEDAPVGMFQNEAHQPNRYAPLLTAGPGVAGQDDERSFQSNLPIKSASQGRLVILVCCLSSSWRTVAHALSKRLQTAAAVSLVVSRVTSRTLPLET